MENETQVNKDWLWNKITTYFTKIGNYLFKSGDSYVKIFTDASDGVIIVHHIKFLNHGKVYSNTECFCKDLDADVSYQMFQSFKAKHIDGLKNIKKFGMWKKI